MSFSNETYSLLGRIGVADLSFSLQEVFIEWQKIPQINTFAFITKCVIISQKGPDTYSMYIRKGGDGKAEKTRNKREHTAKIPKYLAVHILAFNKLQYAVWQEVLYVFTLLNRIPDESG